MLLNWRDGDEGMENDDMYEKQRNLMSELFRGERKKQERERGRRRRGGEAQKSPRRGMRDGFEGHGEDHNNKTFK